MKEQKYHLYLSKDEYSEVLQSLIRLKNSLIAQGRYTDGVDDVLCKVLSAKEKKVQNQIYLNTKRDRLHFCKRSLLIESKFDKLKFYGLYIGIYLFYNCKHHYFSINQHLTYLIFIIFSLRIFPIQSCKFLIYRLIRLTIKTLSCISYKVSTFTSNSTIEYVGLPIRAKNSPHRSASSYVLDTYKQLILDG